MILKAKQISEALGISQASVSLALNNKQGVSEQTKKRVQEYIDSHRQIENNKVLRENNTIKVVSYMSERTQYDKDHSGFHSTILMELTKNANEAGFSIVIVYVHNYEDIKEVLNQSCEDKTSGIVLLGVDMDENILRPFSDIGIPVVLCDNEYQNTSFDCVYSNNEQAVELALDYLIENGHKNINYFYNEKEIYNFRKRREAFKKGVMINDLNSKMIQVGNEIDEIYEYVIKYIKRERELPTAILCENYAVSIAVIKAFQDNGYVIGDDISLIGIDELPKYVLNSFVYSCIRVLFASKGRITINRLIESIDKRPEEIVKIAIENKLIKGSSVKNIKTK